MNKREGELEKKLTSEELVTVMQFYAKQLSEDFFNHCMCCGYIFDKGYGTKLVDLKTNFGDTSIPLSPVEDMVLILVQEYANHV